MEILPELYDLEYLPEISIPLKLKIYTIIKLKTLAFLTN